MSKASYTQSTYSMCCHQSSGGLSTWFGQSRAKGSSGMLQWTLRLAVSSARDDCVCPFRLPRETFLGGLRKLHSRVFFFDILQSNVFCQTKGLFTYLSVHQSVFSPWNMGSWQLYNSSRDLGSQSKQCFIMLLYLDGQLWEIAYDV